MSATPVKIVVMPPPPDLIIAEPDCEICCRTLISDGDPYWICTGCAITYPIDGGNGTWHEVDRCDPPHCIRPAGHPGNCWDVEGELHIVRVEIDLGTDGGSSV